MLSLIQFMNGNVITKTKPKISPAFTQANYLHYELECIDASLWSTRVQLSAASQIIRVMSSPVGNYLYQKRAKANSKKKNKINKIIKNKFQFNILK